MQTLQLVEQVLADNPAIAAVYSSGGGNQAILDAFSNAGRICRAFAAHDLDRTNLDLLNQKQLTFVVHHDMRADARRACLHFLKFHGILPQTFEIDESEFSIVTPYSLGAFHFA